MTIDQTSGPIGPCAKRQVIATLVLPCGLDFVGENVCRNPQPVCPREPEEGYEKCVSVCAQVGHAEVVALTQALHRVHLSSLRGGKLYVEGHDHACPNCRSLAGLLGVDIVIGEPPIRATGFTSAEVLEAANALRYDRFARNGLGRSFDRTVEPTLSDLRDAAAVLSWASSFSRDLLVRRQAPHRADIQPAPPAPPAPERRTPLEEVVRRMLRGTDHDRR